MRVIDLLEDAEVEEEIITITEDVVITRDGEEIFRGGRGGRGRRDHDKRRGPPRDPPGPPGGSPPGQFMRWRHGKADYSPRRHGPPHDPPGKRPEPGDVVTREQIRTRLTRKTLYPKGAVVKVSDKSAAQLVAEGKAVYRI